MAIPGSTFLSKSRWKGLCFRALLESIEPSEMVMSEIKQFPATDIKFSLYSIDIIISLTKLGWARSRGQYLGLAVTMHTHRFTQSVLPDLEPNIFLSCPPTQSITTYSLSRSIGNALQASNANFFVQGRRTPIREEALNYNGAFPYWREILTINVTTSDSHLYLHANYVIFFLLHSLTLSFWACWKGDVHLVDGLLDAFEGDKRGVYTHQEFEISYVHFQTKEQLAGNEQNPTCPTFLLFWNVHT